MSKEAIQSCIWRVRPINSRNLRATRLGRLCLVI
jgi:hypothetical protein